MYWADRSSSGKKYKKKRYINGMGIFKKTKISKLMFATVFITLFFAVTYMFYTRSLDALFMIAFAFSDGYISYLIYKK
jgi:hypothetical protein